MKAFKVTSTEKTESIVFAPTQEEAVSLHTEMVAQGKATVLKAEAKAVRNKEAEEKLFENAVEAQTKILATK